MKNRNISLALSIAFATTPVFAQKKSGKADMPRTVERVNYAKEVSLPVRLPPTATLPPRPNSFISPSIPKSISEYKFKDLQFGALPLPQIPLYKADPNAGRGPMIELRPFSIPEAKQLVDKLVSVEVWKDDDIRLFESYVMLNDLKKNLAAYGAFASLLKSKEIEPETAKWGFGVAAFELGLRSQAEETMMDFITKGSPKMKTQAFEFMVKTSDPDKSMWVQNLPEGIFDNPPSNKTSDAYLILRALRYGSKKEVEAGLKELQPIDQKSKLYGMRIYHEALLRYRQGKLNLALAVLTEAFEKQKVDFYGNKDLETKAALLYGRLAFQSREFNRAFEAFRSVPKSNPLWPEAMMEQALSQILFKDFEGAAGNMFSLHTDFFKKSYSPDSYLIRSIGYLNLCQYADALKVVQDLQRKYKPILTGLENYNKSTNAKQDFETVREFAKNPEVSQIKSIARPFLFAWAKDPGFERHQSRINQAEDEMELFKNLSLEVIKTERDLAAEANTLAGKIAAGPSKKDPSDIMDRWKLDLARVKTEHGLIQQARKSMQALRGSYFADLEKLKEERKKMAAVSLADKRKDMTANLKGILDQAEVLLYEIYSGAGDHMRFEAAGGKVEKRETAALKGTKENEVRWQFRGEIWEDELGHFRSSLNNVCGQETAENTH